MLTWRSDETMAADHFRAETPFGRYLIGPRKRDGAWEYCTPDESWGDHKGHMLENLTRKQAFADVEADFASRGGRLERDVNDDVRAYAFELLETVPDLTEAERVYLGDVANGLHGCLVFRCTVHNSPGAGVLIESPK